MVEGGGNPTAGFVAILAGVARCQMGCAFAGGFGAIVATVAGTCDARMVEGRRYPSGRLVAVFAGVAGCKMGSALARRLRAVVAGEASAGDA